jgi:hypothetical protein
MTVNYSVPKNVMEGGYCIIGCGSSFSVLLEQPLFLLLSFQKMVDELVWQICLFLILVDGIYGHVKLSIPALHFST